MRRGGALLLVAAGCGRVGFDAVVAPDGSASGYREEVLADDPLGYWRLDDLTEERGGPSLEALGGCTLGTPGLIAADPDRAIDFSACTLRIPDAFERSGTSAYSLEAWVESRGAGHVITRQLRDALDPIHGYALLDAVGGLYSERASSGVNVITTRHTLAPDMASHIVATYDGVIVVYADGVEVARSGADPMAMPAHTAELLIGAAQNGGGTYTSHFEGVIDEVAIYGTALPPARIAAHHAAGR